MQLTVRGTYQPERREASGAEDVAHLVLLALGHRHAHKVQLRRRRCCRGRTGALAVGARVSGSSGIAMIAAVLVVLLVLVALSDLLAVLVGKPVQAAAESAAQRGVGVGVGHRRHCRGLCGVRRGASWAEEHALLHDALAPAGAHASAVARATTAACHREVGLATAVRRVRHAVVEQAVIGEQQQPFRLGIQPADW
jgi:hypothetical protein